MKILLSFSSSIFEDKLKQLDLLVKQDLRYMVLNRSLLREGGSYVDFPFTGDLFLSTLVKGSLFKNEVVRVGSATTLKETKEFCIEFVKEDPERYSVCVGYALTLDGEIDYWKRHYWIYDKQTSQLLEASSEKPFLYFGAKLPKEEWVLLYKVEKPKQKAATKPTATEKKVDAKKLSAPEKGNDSKNPKINPRPLQRKVALNLRLKANPKLRKNKEEA